MTSFYIVFATAGGFVASLSSAALLGAMGWRGMAMLGICVTFAGCLARAFVPESVRWLAAKGRFAEARAEVAKQLGMPLQSVPLAFPPSAQLRLSGNDFSGYFGRCFGRLRAVATRGRGTLTHAAERQI